MSPERTCPVCTSSHTEIGLRKSLPEGLLVLLTCAECSHAFIQDPPATFEAHRYEYYAKLLERGREERHTELNAQRYSELLNQWKRSSPGRLLDVGCGDGHLVRVATESGWEAEGIDLSESAIRVASAWGARCRVLDFFDRSLEAQSYDVLHMAELIEHVPAPGQFLARAEQLLKPGGLLYLTTPNFASVSRHMLGADWSPIHFEHLSYFSPRSLSKLISRHTSFTIDLETRNIGLMALVKRLRGPPTPSVDEKGAKTGRADDQSLRKTMYRSPATRLALRLANRALDLTGTGDTIVGRLRKR